jgi:hypothetical protein
MFEDCSGAVSSGGARRVSLFGGARRVLSGGSGAARHKKSRLKKAPGTKKVDAKSQTLTKTLN